MKKFKIGDKIKCIETKKSYNFIINNIYIVENIHECNKDCNSYGMCYKYSFREINSNINYSNQYIMFSSGNIPFKLVKNTKLINKPKFNILSIL